MRNVQGFFSAQATRSHIDARLQRYEQRTERFFARQFPDISMRLNDHERLALIRETYRRAKARGVRSEIDHWKYLIAVAFWGIDFETDPQHASALIRSGWSDADGHPSQSSNLAPILREIDIWAAISLHDMARLRRPDADIIRVCRDEFPELADAPRALDLLVRLWPLKCSVLDEPGSHAATLIWQRAERDRVPAQLRPLYIALSFQFGHGFHRDPLYPSLAVAFSEGSTERPDMIGPLLSEISVPYEVTRCPA